MALVIERGVKQVPMNEGVWPPQVLQEPFDERGVHVLSAGEKSKPHDMCRHCCPK